MLRPVVLLSLSVSLSLLSSLLLFSIPTLGRAAA
jgi:hypothetical protein